MSDSQVKLYGYLIYLQTLAFFSSLFFLILYYKCFHPNRKCGVSAEYKIRDSTKLEVISESS